MAITIRIQYLTFESLNNGHVSKFKGCKAGFHRRRSRNRSSNQTPSAIRSSENQTDGVWSRTLIPLMTPSLTISWKLGCRSLKRKRKNKPMLFVELYSEDLRTSTVIGLFFRFCFRLRQSSFHWIIRDGVTSGIGRKWKRSDSSDSDSVELMTPLTTPIFDFHLVLSSLMTPTTTPTPTPTPSLVKTSLNENKRWMDR